MCMEPVITATYAKKNLLRNYNILLNIPNNIKYYYYSSPIPMKMLQNHYKYGIYLCN